MKRFLLIAGEISGDMHAAELIRELRTRQPDAEFFGVGGDRCREAGMEVLYHTDQTAVMGFAEVLRHIRFFRRMFRQLVRIMHQRKPDAVILIDYPGFNLRFAAKAHAAGCKVLYYVCPQVWAWHRERIPKMAAIIDRLITIFPFEAAHFEGTGMDVAFAGHPLVDAWAAERTRAEQRVTWPADGARVALLPGSRRAEIDRLATRMVDAADVMTQTHPDISFLIACPTPRVEAMVRHCVPELPANVGLVTGVTRTVLRQATAALVASGTATIEAALARCPMVVVYRVAPLTYAIGKRVVKIAHIGMVNVVAQKEICPELIQSEATPTRMAEALAPLISDTPERRGMRIELDVVSRALGEPGTHGRAADLILERLEDNA